MLKEHGEEIEELKKLANEKSNVLNLPTAGWQDPDRKTDEELQEAVMDKVVLHIQHELKYLRDEMFN